MQDPIDTPEEHAPAALNHAMSPTVSKGYTAREETTIKALADTQRDIEKRLEANSIIDSDGQ